MNIATNPRSKEETTQNRSSAERDPHDLQDWRACCPWREKINRGWTHEKALKKNREGNDIATAREWKEQWVSVCDYLRHAWVV